MQVDAASAERFAADLDRLSSRADRLGVAVSGGPDSLALLILANAARPGTIAAATVDHGLRPASADEASFVASICGSMDVPHAILPPDWTEKPRSALQEKARAARYAALGRWAHEQRISAIVTGHHSDDQAETLVMRLARGAGVRGLAGMRLVSPLPGDPSIRLIRPLLGWRRSELEVVCSDAGLAAVEDPSNGDERFERVRIRQSLAGTDWLDAAMLSRTAAYLAAADEAIDWATEREWSDQVDETADGFVYRPDAPAEVRRRVVERIVAKLATEGDAALRGPELDGLIGNLESGGTATLRGVCCSGGSRWSFRAAPRRRAAAQV